MDRYDIIFRTRPNGDVVLKVELVKHASVSHGVVSWISDNGVQSYRNISDYYQVDIKRSN